MIQFLKRKIYAGALQYTMFISVLIILFVSSFLLLSYLNSYFGLQTNVQISTIRNCDIGFDYINVQNIKNNTEIELEPQTTIKSKLNLKKREWGVFEILNVESKIKNQHFEKIGLVGGFAKERPALYMSDLNNSLVVVGNTRIEGDAFLPRRFINRGNIAGHSYYGEKLLYGNTSISSNILPELSNKEYILSLVKGNINQNNATFFEPEIGMNEVNSFKNSVKIYRERGVVELHKIRLTGNYIIQSDTLIRVYNSANLQNVLLLAPNIEINTGVQGSFQAIASNEINVGENCNLKYPSALTVYKDKVETNSNDKSNSILIGSGSTVKGLVIFLSVDNQIKNYSQIFISENSQIYGEVYCDKNIELRGEVNGSVFTNGFIAKQYGAVYKNHIYNGRIIQPNLSNQYVGLQFENTQLKVSEWLY